MPSFTKGPTPPNYAPFGKNVWLRSSQDVKVESGIVAAAAVPSVTVDGVAQKILQPGTVLAKITAAGDDQGKLGPFSAKATDGRQTVANIVGINNTFLPWQLLEGDREVGVAYEAAAVQAYCIELDANDAPIPLTDTTAAALVAKKSLSIIFK